MDKFINHLAIFLTGAMLVATGYAVQAQTAEEPSSNAPASGYEEPAGHSPAAPLPPPATSAQTQPQPQTPSQQQTLVSSTTLVGVPVKDAQGEHLGDIRELMVDPNTGRVAYAVVDSQGALGFGKQKSFAVPWHALHVGLDQTNIVVELDRNQLPILPPITVSQRQDNNE